MTFQFNQVKKLDFAIDAIQWYNLNQTYVDVNSKFVWHKKYSNDINLLPYNGFRWLSRFHISFSTTFSEIKRKNAIMQWSSSRRWWKTPSPWHWKQAMESLQGQKYSDVVVLCKLYMYTLCSWIITSLVLISHFHRRYRRGV